MKGISTLSALSDPHPFICLKRLVIWCYSTTARRLHDLGNILIMKPSPSPPTAMCSLFISTSKNSKNSKNSWDELSSQLFMVQWNMTSKALFPSQISRSFILNDQHDNEKTWTKTTIWRCISYLIWWFSSLPCWCSISTPRVPFVVPLSRAPVLPYPPSRSDGYGPTPSTRCYGCIEDSRLAHPASTSSGVALRWDSGAWAGKGENMFTIWAIRCLTIFDIYRWSCFIAIAILIYIYHIHYVLRDSCLPMSSTVFWIY